MNPNLAQSLRKIQTEAKEGRQVIIQLTKQVLIGSRQLFVAYAAIILVCSLIFLATTYFAGLGIFLSSSASTPWGIITSIFVHGGGQAHLIDNAVGLLAFFLLFSVTGINSAGVKRCITTRLFLALIFVVGIISNFVWIILVPTGHSSGLSGVVYASEGVVTALSFANIFRFFKFGKLDTAEKKKSYLLWFANFLIFLGLIGSITNNPAIFLSAGPGVNVFVHGVAFLGAFLFMMTWSFGLKKEISVLWRGAKPASGIKLK